jgi:hypothetical protein
MWAVLARRIEWLDLLSDRADQAQFIQPGRTQIVDDMPDILDHCLGRPTELRQEFTGPAGIWTDHDGRDLDLHGERGEGWSEPVVQITAESPALLFPGEDQLPSGRLYPPRQQHVVVYFGQVAGDRLDGASIVGGKGSGGIHLHVEIADDGGIRRQRRQ